MELLTVLSIGVGLITVAIGLIGFAVRQGLLAKLFAIDVASTGIIVLFILLSARTGVGAPIVSDPANIDSFTADPFPQGVILTAIVIGFSVEALALVLLRHMAREHPLLRANDFDTDPSQP